MRIIWLLCLCLSTSSASAIENVDSAWIAQKIFQNECAGRDDYLTTWNDGEAFASLGIGHFIWFPKGIHPPFQESFPHLLQYMKQHGVKLPSWLDTPHPYNPWQTKKSL